MIYSIKCKLTGKLLPNQFSIDHFEKQIICPSDNLEIICNNTLGWYISTWNNCTVIVDDNCEINIGNNSTITTKHNCSIQAGENCNFNVGENCDIILYDIDTCTFNYKDNCTIYDANSEIYYKVTKELSNLSKLGLMKL